MFCTKCGKENPDGAQFCGSCGTRVETTFGTYAMPASGPAAEPMIFGKAISTCFSKFATFKGRASRAEYWWFYLFCLLLSWGAMLVDRTRVLSTVVNLVLMIPALAAATRRLHDTNRSGWRQLLYFTIIGIFFVLYWLACKGDEQENRFGMPPV